MSDEKLPRICQKMPYFVEVEPGTYWWCACGKSSEQPFCDGSHKGCGIKPIKIEITEKREIAFCGCKHSKDGYECDGTHKTL